MSIYEINYENIRDIDSYLHVDDPDQYDHEIEDVLARLWTGTGRGQEFLRPIFTIYLQSELLRSLYIHYLALRELGSQYDRVVINASTVILDIVAEYLGFELNPDRTFHDEELFLVRHYDFSVSMWRSRRPYWKRVLLCIGGVCIRTACKFRGVDVLYLNAGKLDDDFYRIPRALSARWVPLRQSDRLNCDIQAIGDQVRKNIRAIKLSIPQDMVVELIEKRVLAHLPDALDRIGALADFIEEYKVKLVIISAVTHEDHLCLLAAARLAEVESLVVAHGVTLAINSFLDHYVTYQATLSNIEPRYEGAAQFSLNANWFEKS